MNISIRTILFAIAVLSPTTLVCALSPTDIPVDTPLSVLLDSANAQIAKGETQDAIVYYDVAVARDPSNYLIHFRRGAAYLSLGRTQQALDDFDRVLVLKPDHKPAYLQRGNIKARQGDWEGAKIDYVGHGESTQALSDIFSGQEAEDLAFRAEKQKDWDACDSHAGTAIYVASKVVSLRRLRARCRLEKGEVEDALLDMRHMIQIQPGLTDPHVQISALSFYALGLVDRGLDQLRKCLHSDPDSKQCKKLYRREKILEKQLAQVEKGFSKKQYAIGLKILNPSQEDPGLLQDVKDDVKEMRESGTIPPKAPNHLVTKVLELLCKAYVETKKYQLAEQSCKEALEANDNSLYGLLYHAHTQYQAGAYEAAMSTLQKAKDNHPAAHSRIDQEIGQTQLELRRSKTKDYYKVLGLSRDADERQIKAAFRRTVKIHHPDKAHKQGIRKEDAEKKMAAINEAYEVLSDPDLKARYDNGDDPNDHTQQRHNPFGQGGFQFQGNPFAQGGGFSGGGQQFHFKFGNGGGFRFG